MTPRTLSVVTESNPPSGVDLTYAHVVRPTDLAGRFVSSHYSRAGVLEMVTNCFRRKRGSKISGPDTTSRPAPQTQEASGRIRF